VWVVEGELPVQAEEKEGGWEGGREGRVEGDSNSGKAREGREGGRVE